MAQGLPFDVQFELLIWLTITVALVGLFVIVGLRIAWQRSLRRDQRRGRTKGVDQEDLWRVAGQRLTAKYDAQHDEQDEKRKDEDNDDDKDPPGDGDDGRRSPW